MTHPFPLKKHPLRKASQSEFEAAEAEWRHVLSIQVEETVVESDQHLMVPLLPLKASQAD